MFDRIFNVSPKDNRFLYIIKSLISRFNEHDIAQNGGQLAYYFLLSMFPFLIFLNALIGSFNISATAVVDFLKPFFPAQIVSLISSYVEHITQNQSMSLLSIGIIVTIFSASRAVKSLEITINNAYGIREKRGFVPSILYSILFIILTGILVLISLIFVAFSKDLLVKLFSVLHIPFALVNLLNAWRWITLTVTIFFVLALLYLIIPNKKLKFISVIPGIFLSLAGFLALMFGFSIYVNNFMRQSALYGSIGAILLLMLWLYFAGIILILGAELNNIIESLPEHLENRRRLKK